MTRRSKLVDVSDLITHTEAARLRGVARASIYGLVRRGRLRGLEIGGRLLVFRSEVLAFERQKPGPKLAKGAGKGKKV